MQHKYIRLFVTFIGMLLPMTCWPATNEEQLSTRELLELLDDAIEKKEEYQSQRVHLGDSLRQLALTSTGEERISVLSQMYDTYLNFNTDSTLSVLAWMKRLPEYAVDSKLRTQTLLDEARVYGMMGFYAQAFNMLREVRLSELTPESRLRYYNTQHSILGWRAEFADGVLSTIAPELHRQAAIYHDSLLLLEPDPINRTIISSNRLYDEGRYQESIDSLLSLRDHSTTEQRIYTYSNLSQAYGRLGEKELQLRFLILTALSDIRAGITEYMALPFLAQQLFMRGDAVRAYNYMFCALEDANLCKSSLRSIEASTIFPIIDHAHHERMAHDRRDSLLAMAALLVVALILGAGLLWTLRLNRKLRAVRQLLAKANNELKVANTQLRDTNQELTDANRQREQYLLSFLARSRSYLGSFDTVQHQMLKQLQAHQYEDLVKRLKSTELMEGEQARFYADFDSAFLTLYPNFIECFNALLRPESAVWPKKGELLTTELRIYALIRMGETDSAKIANFLNYSLATIYNYRSRVRNAALDKNTFEDEVMRL